MPAEKLSDSAEVDRDLLQRVRSSLQQRGYTPHRLLEISAERSVVTVHGRLPSFYLRQIAVECIHRVAGVDQIIDLIEVSGDPDRSQDHVEHQGEFPIIAARDCLGPPELVRAASIVHRPKIRKKFRLSHLRR